jgi:hypothetical protein
MELDWRACITRPRRRQAIGSLEHAMIAAAASLELKMITQNAIRVLSEIGF